MPANGSIAIGTGCGNMMVENSRERSHFFVILFIYKGIFTINKSVVQPKSVKWDHIDMKSSKNQFPLRPKSPLKH